MGRQVKRVLLIGHFAPGMLERSYCTAFNNLGCEVENFDITRTVERFCRFGRFGNTFNRFVPVEAWIRKANREMVQQFLKSQPDLILTFGQHLLQTGALATINTFRKTTLVHVWPDPLLSLGENLIACLPLFDLIATFNGASVEQFEILGARRVAWIPLAGDPLMHPQIPCTDAEQSLYGADITFIGGWRPERETLLAELVSFNLKIWGPEWKRYCRNKDVLNAYQGRDLREIEFAKAINCSKINLNIIDPLGYPAANMRFFEIPVAGGLQVSSSCPEMEREFLDGEHLFYYKDVEHLRNIVSMLIQNANLREKVALAAHQKVLAAHTYTSRAQMILEHCGYAAGDH
jgi:hypothetical protein